MTSSVVAEAAALFAVTNIDDIVVLSLFFAQGAGQPGSATRIVAGQYLGFIAILAIAVAAGSGATFLPEGVIPYLGLIPLALGLKAAWRCGETTSAAPLPRRPDATGAARRSWRSPASPSPMAATI